jgi:catechol-2,3-dioxygenase
MLAMRRLEPRGKAASLTGNMIEKGLRMKRLHVHLAVDDLDRSIRFYSNLFGAEPTVVKDDYAKWMLDDPHVNFAVSARQHAHKASSISASRSRVPRR